MSTLEIRPAQTDDAAAACEVVRRSIVELCEPDHGNDPTFLSGWLANKTPENVAAWITNPGNVFYVAIEGGKITGLAAMTKAGMITLNYVSPDARFKGVSKALLAALETKAKALGVAQCRLESTKTARQFYQAAGYREAEAAKGGVCQSMVKNLS